VLERGQHFPVWQYAAVAREDDGKVFIAVHEGGEVEVHEGFLEATAVQSRRKRKRGTTSGEGEEAGEAAETEQNKATRPELTKAAENYLALHRHAIVRAELLRHPGIALRLVIAHIIAGSPLWTVKADAQRADKEKIADSVRGSVAQAAFNAEREAILTLLELEPSYAGTVARPNADPYQAASVFARLLTLADEDVARVLAFVMAETLSVGSALVDAAGVVMKPDVAQSWQADQTFLDLVRDRNAVNAMLAEVAGRAVADGNVSETAKVQKTIIRDCLIGAAREKVEGWIPGYMAFPIRIYDDNASVRLAGEWKRVAALFPAA
jgi:ParB family chromosome partitioning protein